MYDNSFLSRSRMHSQADFYSLFGALIELNRLNTIPEILSIVERILNFNGEIESNDLEKRQETNEYYNATRSASNDKGPRLIRIEIMKKVLLAEI